MTSKDNNLYIDRAKKMAGQMFDFAVNSCGIEGDSFWDMFVCSGISKQVEAVNPKYVSGKSGAEIVMDVADIVEVEVTPKDNNMEGRSAAYWCGWALLQYQMHSGLSYKDIHNMVSFDELMAMYPTLHEASIEKFKDIMDKKWAKKDSRLKKQREISNMSQSELAKSSGVSIKTIQAYEQRLKDINQGKYVTLQNLSETLNCDIRDILE